MKKNFAALLTVAAVLTAVPAMAAAPEAARHGWDSRQCQNLSDNDEYNDGWYCENGRCVRGHGRHDGSCWRDSHHQ